MRRVVWAAVAFGLVQACATVAPARLSLPPREAPLEERVAAYRAHAAMPHVGFSGWAFRVGDGAVRDLDEARPLLANAAQAEAIFQERDARRAAGWGLVAGGLATTLGALIALPILLDARDDALTPTLSVMALGGGAEVVGALLLSAGERKVPFAAEAYNRWLWDALALPVGGRSTQRTPHPAPWRVPP
ncbi:MAG: hypothetical protein U0324_03200 [Polyangiales bacterium]